MRRGLANLIVCENIYLEMGQYRNTTNRMKKNLYEKLLEKGNLQRAYLEISTSKGANTGNPGQEDLDGYSNQVIEQEIKRLKNHTFQFKPIRRVYIPKRDGKMRPLGIPNPCDKVVQKAMVNILEKIYEPEFSNLSHGFRPRRSCHTALKEITTWKGTKWFIEGDISKYFDTINHHKLAQILGETIDDKQFMDLYWKAVKAKYINPLTQEIEYGEQGTPQGGTLSPILSNIYLDKLDKFMEKEITLAKNSGPTLEENPEWKKLHTKISNMKQVLSLNYRYKRQMTDAEIKVRKKEIQDLIKKRHRLKSRVSSEGYRIYYVRYADDFLIGINGRKKVAVELKERIRKYLGEELHLELNTDKTKITSALKNRALFLGAHIRAMISRTSDQKMNKKYYTKTNKQIKARITSGYITLNAPIVRIIKRLRDQGICWIKDPKKYEYIPKRKTAWINLPLSDMIEKYNYVWRGILHYYSFAYNLSQLNIVQYILHHSAACTIMNKLKLSSRAKVFKRYGKTLKVPKGEKDTSEFSLEASLKRIKKFSTKDYHVPYEIFRYNLRTKNPLNEACSICGSKENIEMHHRRRLKNKKTNNTFHGIKIAMQRKQIPVCSRCHQNIHKGLYDGKSLS